MVSGVFILFFDVCKEPVFKMRIGSFYNGLDKGVEGVEMIDRNSLVTISSIGAIVADRLDNLLFTPDLSHGATQK